MGKKHKLFKKDFGSIGIGAMIIFISMVLVAGIAASVLVQTANRLEMQAMTTGQETEAEVATGIHVIDVGGYRSGAADIDYLGIMIAPWAGAKEVDLSQTYVEISDTNIKNVLKYDSTEFHGKAEINGDMWDAGFFDGLDGTTFGIIIIEDADNSCNKSTPVINRGDKVVLTCLCGATGCFGQELAERTDVWGMVQAEDGAAGVFSFRTPSSYTDSVFDLY